MSEDPLEFTGGDINLYAYVWNSPLNFVDPSGEAAIKVPSCEPSPPPIDGKKNFSTPQSNDPLGLLLGSPCDPENWMTWIPGPAMVKIPGNMKAAEWLSKMVKGKVMREFPSEYLDKTINEILRDAKAGIKTAQKARKLLTNQEYRIKK